MTNPPRQHVPQGFPPQQQPGQPVHGYPPQQPSAPRNAHPGQPQQGFASPQYQWAPPEPGYAPQQSGYAPQPGGAPYNGGTQQPGFAPGPGMPQFGESQPPAPPQRPFWKSPLVLGLGALVLVLVVALGVVLASGGDDDPAPTAAATTTTAASTSAAATTTRAKPTTTTKAVAPIPSAVQPAVDALPDALRQALVKNDVKERPGEDVTNGGYDAKATFTLNARDPLLQGLMRHADNDYYPAAYLVKDPAKLLHIWQSVKPQLTAEEGTRMVRIDDTDASVVFLEIFVPQSKLYFELNGFQSADAARQFIQRAGF